MATEFDEYWAKVTAEISSPTVKAVVIALKHNMLAAFLAGRAAGLKAAAEACEAVKDERRTAAMHCIHHPSAAAERNSAAEGADTCRDRILSLMPEAQ